jgi:hypothetical protein
MVDPKSQPFFKLHGSSNWRDSSDSTMLIIGGDKTCEIQRHPILSWYFSQFQEYLSKPDTRLMIIGYGFRDSHINDVITHAIQKDNLKFFVIDPSGADIVRKVNPSYGGQIYAPNNLDDAFKQGLIGASRRTLREIFGTDTVEHQKVQRFFSLINQNE